MASTGSSSATSSRWLSLAVAMAFLAIAAFILSKHIDEFAREAIAKQEPELQLPLVAIIHEEPKGNPRRHEDEGWSRIKVGSLSLELPGEPYPDPKPGWFDSYSSIEKLSALRLPVEHRLSLVRLSAVRHTSGKLSLQAAALAAKHGLTSELPGVTTIYPFEFRNLEARHLGTRPVNVDEKTRIHTYLILHNNEMLVLSVKGHDHHPNRLAHQILRTIEFN